MCWQEAVKGIWVTAGAPDVTVVLRRLRRLGTELTNVTNDFPPLDGALPALARWISAPRTSCLPACRVSLQ